MSKALSAALASWMLVVFALILFMASFLLFYCYHRNNRFRRANPATPSPLIRIIIATEQGTVPRRGLDNVAIQVLPFAVFLSGDGVLECTICLSELEEGEEARVLPRCNHGFHLQCIDAWLQSNTTCPLCRSPVCSDSGAQVVQVAALDEVSGDGNSTESPDFHSNERSGAAGSASRETEGMLVIEIPRREVDGFLMQEPPLPSSRLTVEDIKPTTSASLRFLRGFLSWGSRGTCHCSSRGGDVGQGTGACCSN